MEGAGHPVCIQAYSRSFVTNYTRLALRFLLSLSLFRLMGKEVAVAEFRDVRQWLVFFFLFYLSSVGLYLLRLGI